MKKSTVFFFVIFLSLFIVSNLRSQWIQQNSGTNYRLFSIFLNDANTVYAAGFDPANIRNTIHKKTTDGGSNWVQLNINPNMCGFRIYFLNSTTGFMGGWYSILATTNAGINWNSVYTAPDTAVIFCIHFPVPSTGYGFGGILNSQNQFTQLVLMKTSNGGINWYRLDPPINGSGKEPHSVYFIDANTGYIAGWSNGGLLLKTINGGITWNNMTIPSNLVNLNKVIFIDANTGYLGGNYNISHNTSAIFKTTNAGLNWFSSYITPDSLFSGDMNDIYFVNSNTGFGVGEGIIVKTTNAGLNWIVSKYIPDHPVLYSVMFSDANTGYVSGDNGRILKTTNGGSVFISKISSDVPDKYSLCQNYPNPFNPSTNVKYQIAKTSTGSQYSFVRLVVYDIVGKEVETLVYEKQSAGTYEVSFDATRLSSGVYYYRLHAGDFMQSKKMLLIK